jgi:hypothetical protein
MRLAIVGSRDYPNLDEVRQFVDSLPNNTVVVSGGAGGVDTAAEEAARKRGLGVIIFPALWGAYGRGAGFIRNKQIVETADEVVAFWHNNSRGTAHTVGLAEKAGKPVKIIRSLGI